MSVLFADKIEKAYGDRLVLRGCSLRLDKGERLGLVGVNGAGKSTLLRILTGAETLDHGRVQRNGSLSHLEQRPNLRGPAVLDAVSQATEWHRELLKSYEEALTEGDLERAGDLQDRLDQVGWDLGHNIRSILTQLDAPGPERAIEGLSGGEVRRVALARTLLSGADILILDEPTNHLDATTIEWLESFLKGYRGAVLLVTHDRYLLEEVATGILEIEDGETVSYEGSYGDYLVARAERQARLQVAEERRLKLLASEAAWAARSPAARSTKQKARLQRLDRLRGQRGLSKERGIAMEMKTGDRFGRVLVEASGIHFSYGPTPLFTNLSFSIPPGTRLGIVGPNGAGKSTLLKVLSGHLQPQRGKVLRAGRVKLGILDQQRSGLDPEKTLFETAGGGGDHVQLGERSVHVATFLRRFLFPREMLDQKVGSLSGGERARILLAKLILEGANLILLDEPTNDLDLLTLRALEEALIDFSGAVIVVTHDRAFLDRICTSVLSFEPEGAVVEYADRQQAMGALRVLASAKVEAPKEVKTQRRSDAGSVRLTYKETRELSELPDRIEVVEAKQEALTVRLNDPEIYQDPSVDHVRLNANLEALGKELEELYERWAALAERADEG
jgi:ABC transport system ATP-binding/permease protein